MKKFWLLVSAIAMALALSSCADKTEEKAEGKTTAEPTEEEVKKSMVKFYMTLEREINAIDADLNAYENADEPDTEQKAKASEAAAAVTTKIKELEIPSELEDKKASIEAALNDYAAAYQTKADELKKDAPALEAANETIAQGDEKLGKVFEELKLLKPSLARSVS